ncbi:hypothetical protein A6770_38905 [Nostoc minutum NIES-26]|uniref:Uncharacterized protein n=1 Tax=Nostoc minutum NIES-26 TaxID=1844469 RepID=A0A367RTY6_9NOSO|nr:hypothetical protein A6770_38905 [Nostoc minutum NIES-26]
MKARFQLQKYQCYCITHHYQLQGRLATNNVIGEDVILYCLGNIKLNLLIGERFRLLKESSKT